MSKFRLLRASLILTALALGVPAHAQINWTNVYSPPVADSSRQMDSARNSMNDAFDQLKNVVKAQEENDRKNWEVRKNTNTQDYLDALYSNKTVRELLANQDALDRKRVAYGAQTDREVARSAGDARLSALMQQERAMSVAVAPAPPPAQFMQAPIQTYQNERSIAVQAGNKTTVAPRGKNRQKALANPDFWHGVTFNLIGTNTYYSNGVVSRREGEETIYSNGAKSTTTGTIIHFSTGEVCYEKQGTSTIYCK